MPPSWIDWPELTTSHQLRSFNHECQLIGIVLRFLRLRTVLKRQQVTDYKSFSLAMLAIENDLEKWAEDAPSLLSFQTLEAIEEPSRCYTNKYHVYQDHWVAKVWNGYRIVRICVNELILRRLLPNPSQPPLYLGWSRETAAIQHAQGLLVLRQMATDICYSIPSYMNYIDRYGDPDPQLSGMISLLWSLRAAAENLATSDEMSSWCLEILDEIGDNAGNKFASHVAAKVRTVQRLRKTNVASQPELPVKKADEYELTAGSIEVFGLATLIREPQ